MLIKRFNVKIMQSIKLLYKLILVVTDPSIVTDTRRVIVKRRARPYLSDVYGYIEN